MKHLFVSQELSKKLREKGFEYHPVNMAAPPIYQQVVDWLREKHKIHIEIIYRGSVNDYCGEIRYVGSDFFHDYNNIGYRSSEDYYDALTKIIEEALKLI